jgi:Global regulator protein family
MLALTRRIGEAVKIGDSVRLTVRHRIRELMLIDLTAPAGSRLTCENAPLTSMPASSGLERYLCSVLAGERLNLGDILIVFCSPRGARGHNRQILLRIDAPLEFAISREDARAEDPHHLAGC